MPNAMVPELAVSDWKSSKEFYCTLLGFECLYERPEEGFCYLQIGKAELMLDQMDVGRSFDQGHLPTTYPFGRGINFQIQVPDITRQVKSLQAANYPLFLPVEDKWYRVGNCEEGNRQFMVADPDGYLLRFFQDLGSRPIGANHSAA